MVSQWKDPLTIVSPGLDETKPYNVGGVSQVVAPALAQVARLLQQRQAWQLGTPLEMSAELYWKAREEMRQVQCVQRGFKFVPTDDALMRRGVENFLFHGTPIVLIPDDGAPPPQPEQSSDEAKRWGDRLFLEAERKRRLRGYGRI